MQTVGLTWQHSVEVAAVLAATGGAMALSARSRVRNAGAFLRETAVIGVLYGLWRLAGEISQSGVDHAFDRARWIQRIEGYLPLPSEHAVQHAILGHSHVVQAANLYYATMHMTTMLVFLIWLFVRHRDRYRPIRMTMAWTTLACLLIQLTPVAPPRLLAHSGLVDTGLLYNQSVYSNGLAFDQMSAMPSVHVAWAVCVGWYVWRVSPSRWRWAGPAHAVITILVVVATGNHWWLDGIVAVALLAASAWAVYGGRAGVGALVDRWRAAREPLVGEPEPVAVG
ncbi:MAG TPA: phosphatase PAP2 family protein [Jatrophihabitans sp.]|uniref:phosphatase PAP2 family protein n=1 Tax=Jatrophihabitans sp. TaxID=1932789 RepID=UPI002E08C07D|nr:phosphatase PAP2 family protein [Jatrophihabitans sp.]